MSLRFTLDGSNALERRLAGRPHHRWARACAAEINSAALHGEDPELLWRRIPGAAILDGRGRAALRSLVIWREATAIRKVLRVEKSLPKAPIERTQALDLGECARDSLLDGRPLR